jgi:hypothetical protein
MRRNRSRCNVVFNQCWQSIAGAPPACQSRTGRGSPITVDTKLFEPVGSGRPPSQNAPLQHSPAASGATDGSVPDRPKAAERLQANSSSSLGAERREPLLQTVPALVCASNCTSKRPP